MSPYPRPAAPAEIGVGAAAAAHNPVTTNASEQKTNLLARRADANKPKPQTKTLLLITLPTRARRTRKLSNRVALNRVPALPGLINPLMHAEEGTTDEADTNSPTAAQTRIVLDQIGGTTIAVTAAMRLQAGNVHS